MLRGEVHHPALIQVTDDTTEAQSPACSIIQVRKHSLFPHSCECLLLSQITSGFPYKQQSSLMTNFRTTVETFPYFMLTASLAFSTKTDHDQEDIRDRDEFLDTLSAHTSDHTDLGGDHPGHHPLPQRQACIQHAGAVRGGIVTNCSICNEIQKKVMRRPWFRGWEAATMATRGRQRGTPGCQQALVSTEDPRPHIPTRPRAQTRRRRRCHCRRARAPVMTGSQPARGRSSLHEPGRTPTFYLLCLKYINTDFIILYLQDVISGKKRKLEHFPKPQPYFLECITCPIILGTFSNYDMIESRRLLGGLWFPQRS